jgi:dolichyl-phosphate beta-glucosyltransferase
MDLSIVIPAYNEAHKIEKDVAAAAEFLRRQRLSGEVIIADDGSADATAAAARKAPSVGGIPIRVIELPHKGKGSAVRQGILASRGDYVLFADSGLCVPFEDALPALTMLQSGQADIVNGSRKLPDSVISRPQSRYRRILSRMFRLAVRLYMGLPGGLSDTQCGFKIYRGDVARDIYGSCSTDGFMFDLEVLLRAFSRRYRVAEVPVHWTCDRDTRLRPSKILFRTFGELREVKRHVAEELAAAEAILPAATPKKLDGNLASAGAETPRE